MKIPKTFRPEKDGTNSRPRSRRLERVLDQTYNKLDYEVETKKQELDYIARLTEEYWDQLKDIFKPKKNIGTRDLEILLFKLGWVDILEDDDKYIFYVTPTGKEIVDDLKTIRKQKFDKYPTKQQKRRKKKPKL